jgi:hypothetical protein
MVSVYAMVSKIPRVSTRDGPAVVLGQYAPARRERSSLPSDREYPGGRRHGFEQHLGPTDQKHPLIFIGINFAIPLEHVEGDLPHHLIPLFGY